MSRRGRITKALVPLLGLLFLTGSAWAVGQPAYVESRPAPGSFALVQGATAAPIHVDGSDWPGVVRAARDLQSDIHKVTGRRAALSLEVDALPERPVLVGTVGKSRLIERLAQSGKIDTARIAGQWETFLTQVVADPFPGVRSALVIAGSDKRGTIFGIYDLSEQMGVSPSWWWADVPVPHRDRLFVRAGTTVQGPPSVRYRGIFINDEAPNLSEWVRHTYGSVPPGEDPPVPEGVANYNSAFYARVFETILRMKGNYLWPAMWNNAFNEDDAENARLADEYGIVMGTSHQEPMLRAQKEWDRRHQKTLGSWNYYRHPEVLEEFWRAGVRRNRDFESILTIGLRGANDTPMIPGGTVAQSMELLEKIVGVQRGIIAREINPDVTAVPQLWCLYKEVVEFYNAGLRVPDDVTLLWPDDNWGNIRRLPTGAERGRAGGAGIYYHFDYVGGPRNYKWINTVSLPSVWEQMSLAKLHGADRIWIVNVGHFRHVLYPMEFFLQYGWNTERWNHRNLGEFTRLWAAREFGAAHAAEAADIMETYSRYVARRKPELLSPSTYSQLHYREAERVVEDFGALAARAEELHRKLRPTAREAFYTLVLHPVKALGQVYALYAAAGANALYASQGRASAGDMADRVEELFEADARLSDHYNRVFAGGKWNHFADQVHIGYTMWNDPPRNIMPKVTRLDLPAEASLGVAVEGSAEAWPRATAEGSAEAWPRASAEGSAEAWPGAEARAQLPVIDPFNRQRRYLDVFNRGREPFVFSAEARQPWIRLSERRGDILKERRLWVSVDWDRVPEGATEGDIRIGRAGGESVDIRVPLHNPAPGVRKAVRGFIESDGHIAIEAAHFTRSLPAGGARWEEIEGYGRTRSAMTVFPRGTPSVLPPGDSPALEYGVYVFEPGKAEVCLTVAPTLNFTPGRGLRLAVSIDEEPARVVTILPEGFDARNGNREWEESVRNASRTVRSVHELAEAGYHTLKIRMVDPSVVLERIVVDLGGARPSYLGPPESPLGR